MIFRNNNGKSYVLHVYLKKDCDLTELAYTVDKKEYVLYLSNKGYYSIYLGPFSKLNIKDNAKCIYELVEQVKDYGKLFKKFKINSEKVIIDSDVVRDKPYIFSDLINNDGNDLYCSFNRLFKITLRFKESLDMSLLDDILYGLDFLMNNWYTGKANYSGNWWFYEIGVPRCLNEILFLLKDYIEPDKLYNYLNIERFYLPDAKYIFYRRNYPVIYRECATYANLAENIYICTLRSVLQHTYNELDYLFKLIEDTLCIVNTHDGFYADGSFIQHGNVPYNGSYGEVLLISLSKILNVFLLLNYDCSEYVKRIQNILFDSYSPFMFDGKVLESVRGRAVSRVQKNSRYSFDTIMHSVERLKKLFSTSKLKSFIKIEENRSYVKYSKSFNYMDRFIARNKNYVFSINSNSNYISNYECINGENLLGDYSSNYTYDLLFINDSNLYNNPLYVNPYYRNGSTNSFEKEEPNYVYKNNITAGADMDCLLSTCWDQNTDVNGYFSKFVLNNSLVAYGNNIKSEKEYISTIFNFNEEHTIENNNVNIGKIKIITNDNYVIEEFKESRCPKDLNVNQDMNYYDYKIKRMYLKNPSKYEYQIYPENNGIDKYELIDLGNCHILKYENYLLINSFEENEVRYENIKFKGRFSAILCFKNNSYYLKLSTGSREKKTIEFAINHFKMKKDQRVVKKNIINLMDELVHSYEFVK